VNLSTRLASLRPLLSMEVALLVLILAAAVGAFYLFQQAKDAESQQLQIEKRLATAKADLQYFNTQNEKASLTAEVQRLRNQQPAKTFTPHRDALTASTTVGQYVVESGLVLKSLSSDQTTVPIGKTSYPAVRLALELGGTPDKLIGVLGMVHELPPTVVQGLKLTKATEAKGGWTMDLTLLVPYDPSGG